MNPAARRLPGARLRCGHRRLSLDVPRVMGILNVTPDSFSDGGRFAPPPCAGTAARALPLDIDRVVAAARAMVDAGAAVLDVGGESTRPGAAPVSGDEELRRVVPVVERLAALDVIVSVDTSKPEVAAAALDAGATLINDVRALQAPGMLALAARRGAAVCLMHMHGEPATMQDDPHYDDDVVTAVRAFLGERVHAARQAGIDEDRMLIDPGFGFGKTLAHNLSLLRRLDEIATLGPPLLVGMSRKGMLGAITGRPVGERTAAGVAAALAAVQRGARVIRTHDVAATVDALAVFAALDGTADAPCGERPAAPSRPSHPAQPSAQSGPEQSGQSQR